jgi:hypothetical protein
MVRAQAASLPFSAPFSHAKPLAKKSRKSFPQSMCKKSKGVIDLCSARRISQLIEKTCLARIAKKLGRKKGDRFLGVRLQKLLKTHVEKMSGLGLVQKLLINQVLINALKAS